MYVRQQGANGDASDINPNAEGYIEVGVEGEAYPRLRLHTVSGKIEFGSGAAEPDASIHRSAAGVLTTTGVVVGSSVDVVSTVAASGASTDLDVNDGNVFEVTLGADTEITVSNPHPAGQSTLIAIYLTQDGTGNRLVTWPAAFKWPSGVAPTLSTGAGKRDLVVAESTNGGSTYSAMMTGQDIR